jgi:hypothetical protein
VSAATDDTVTLTVRIVSPDGTRVIDQTKQEMHDLARASQEAAKLQKGGAESATAAYHQERAELMRIRKEIEQATGANRQQEAAAKADAAAQKALTVDLQRQAAEQRLAAEAARAQTAATHAQAGAARAAGAEQRLAAEAARAQAAAGHAQAVAARAAGAELKLQSAQQRASASTAAEATAKGEGFAGLLGRVGPAATAAAMAIGAVIVPVMALKAAFEAGFGFNSQIESMKLGISAIVSAQNTITDSNGRQLQGTEKLAAAQGAVADVFDRLKQDAIDTTATLPQLVSAFNAALAPATAAHLTLDQTRQVTVGLVQAAGAVGVPMDQIRQEVQSILRGQMDNNTVLKDSLNISNDQIKSWTAQGTLAKNLLKVLEDFIVAGKQAGETWEGATSTLKDNLMSLAGIFTGAAFETVKGKIQELNATAFGPDAQQMAAEWGVILQDGVRGAIDLAIGLGKILLAGAEEAKKAYIGLKFLGTSIGAGAARRDLNVREEMMQSLASSRHGLTPMAQALLSGQAYATTAVGPSGNASQITLPRQGFEGALTTLRKRGEMTPEMERIVDEIRQEAAGIASGEYARATGAVFQGFEDAAERIKKQHRGFNGRLTPNGMGAPAPAARPGDGTGGRDPLAEDFEERIRRQAEVNALALKGILDARALQAKLYEERAAAAAKQFQAETQAWIDQDQIDEAERDADGARDKAVIIDLAKVREAQVERERERRLALAEEEARIFKDSRDAAISAGGRLLAGAIRGGDSLEGEGLTDLIAGVFRMAGPLGEVVAGVLDAAVDAQRRFWQEEAGRREEEHRRATAVTEANLKASEELQRAANELKESQQGLRQRLIGKIRQASLEGLSPEEQDRLRRQMDIQDTFDEIKALAGKAGLKVPGLGMRTIQGGPPALDSIPGFEFVAPPTVILGRPDLSFGPGGQPTGLPQGEPAHAAIPFAPGTGPFDEFGRAKVDPYAPEPVAPMIVSTPGPGITQGEVNDLVDLLKYLAGSSRGGRSVDSQLTPGTTPQNPVYMHLVNPKDIWASEPPGSRFRATRAGTTRAPQQQSAPMSLNGNVRTPSRGSAVAG